MHQANNVVCSNCQQPHVQFPQRAKAETSTKQSFDLDGRPTGNLRDNFKCSLQYCDCCGLVAPQLTTASLAADLLQSIPYQLQLADETKPFQARLFLCYSILMEDCGKYFKAAQHTLYAAWICDDEHNLAQAKQCRQLAAALFESAIKKGQINEHRLIDARLLLTDLFRRAFDFEQAIDTVVQVLNSGNCSEQQKQCARFQLMLSTEKDAACYNNQILQN